MTVEAMAIVLHHSVAKGTDKVILLGIANHDGDGGAFPAVSTLARYANVSERMVQYSINKLVESGELHVSINSGGTIHTPKHARTNLYSILVQCPEACDRTKNHRVQSASPGETHFTPPGETHFTPPVKPIAPEPSLKPSLEPKNLSRASHSPVAPTALPDLFDEFWKVYPAKKGKIAARKAWVRALKSASPDVIIAGAMIYRTDSRVLSGYVKDPATWLNGGHWDDETTGAAEKTSASRPALPASNAPQIIPAAEKCPEHVGFRVGACSPCASERKGIKVA